MSYQKNIFVLYVITQHFFIEKYRFWWNFPLNWIRQIVSIALLSFLLFWAFLSKMKVGLLFISQQLLICKHSIIAYGHHLMRVKIQTARCKPWVSYSGAGTLDFICKMFFFISIDMCKHFQSNIFVHSVKGIDFMGLHRLLFI